MTVRTVAMLTAGGLAPCLSSAVGGLIQRYTELAPDVRIIAYTNGYAGLLRGDSIEVTPQVRERAHLLHRFGGSPIGNSRVKLTNVADCVKRGLVQEGEDPLKVAAERLKADGVDVLHTIGGDDTNTTAADLAAYLHENGYAGLLKGEYVEVTPEVREKAHLLHRYGGSPIGNSRVKLTNTADCVKRGLVKEGENPLRVAAERLAADGITILHLSLIHI